MSPQFYTTINDIKFFEKALLNVCKDYKMYSMFGNITSVRKCISELRICSDKIFIGRSLRQGILLRNALPSVRSRPQSASYDGMCMRNKNHNTY